MAGLVFGCKGKKDIVIGRHGIGYLKANEASFYEAKVQLNNAAGGFQV